MTGAELSPIGLTTFFSGYGFSSGTVTLELTHFEGLFPFYKLEISEALDT